MSNITPLDRWSSRYEKCLNCGTTTKLGKFRHEARGLCKMCYGRFENRKLKLGKPENFWRLMGMFNTVSSPTAKAYQENQKTRIVKFKNFIRSWFEEEFFKMNQEGIKWKYETEEIEIDMVLPMNDKELLSFPNHLEEFKNCLEEYLKNKGGS